MAQDAPVVVLGAAGQLGSDLCRRLKLAGVPFIPLTHQELDICREEEVARTLRRLRPWAVVNTAAFHRVEACEEEPLQAFAVNAVAVRALARACRQVGALLVHISTDYVFGGEKGIPYREDDPPSPINVYGASKAAGEMLLRAETPHHIIVRTSGLFGLRGSSVKGGNFVETMLRLGQERGEVHVVTDQVLSPTYTLDLAEKIWQLLRTEAQGTFHVTNAGYCSWYEFACAIFQLAGMEVKVHPVTSDFFPSRARRPAFSVLENARLREEGYGLLRPWREALAAYLQERRRLTSDQGEVK
jgi:dTDP-4-dehydrorhamnose reductase